MSTDYLLDLIEKLALSLVMYLTLLVVTFTVYLGSAQDVVGELELASYYYTVIACTHEYFTLLC